MLHTPNEILAMDSSQSFWRNLNSFAGKAVSFHARLIDANVVLVLFLQLGPVFCLTVVPHCTFVRELVGLHESFQPLAVAYFLEEGMIANEVKTFLVQRTMQRVDAFFVQMKTGKLL